METNRLYFWFEIINLTLVNSHVKIYVNDANGIRWNHFITKKKKTVCFKRFVPFYLFFLSSNKTKTK